MRALRLLIPTVVLATSATVHAGGSVTIAPGVTGEGGYALNLSLSRDWQRRWLESDSGYLGGYWNFGWTGWNDRTSRDVHTLSVSPVFVYRFTGPGWQPFIEFGVGVAFFSGRMIDGHDLGSRTHFEDRLGFGLELDGRQRLAVRVIHYSNGGLKKPNEGINAWSLVYSRDF